MPHSKQRTLGMLFSVTHTLLKKLRYKADPLQIQKLVYIAFGFYAAEYDRYLFGNRIEAWKYGPVMPELYRELKTGGGRQISEAKPIVDNDVLGIIDDVVRTYGRKKAFSLVDYTHAANTPWSKVYDGTKGKEIPKQLIKEHYKALLHVRKVLMPYKSVFEALAKT